MRDFDALIDPVTGQRLHIRPTLLLACKERGVRACIRIMFPGQGGLDWPACCVNQRQAQQLKGTPV